MLAWWQWKSLFLLQFDEAVNKLNDKDAYVYAKFVIQHN